jgi:hypothetical protein
MYRSSLSQAILFRGPFCTLRIFKRLFAAAELGFPLHNDFDPSCQIKCKQRQYTCDNQVLKQDPICRIEKVYSTTEKHVKVPLSELCSELRCLNILFFLSSSIISLNESTEESISLLSCSYSVSME